MKTPTTTPYTTVKTYLDACRTLDRRAHIGFLYRHLDSNTRAFYMLRVIAHAIACLSPEADSERWVVTFALSGNNLKTTVSQLVGGDEHYPFTFPGEESARYFECNFSHLMLSVLI